MTITVSLPRERRYPGVLRLEEGGARLFSCRCLGKADSMAAARAHNPSRDPLAECGDTPLGEYAGRVVRRASCEDAPRCLAIVLRPVAGPALASGRADLAIHGGEPGSAGLLRPTHGCVRVDDDRLARIVELIGTRPVRVLVSESAS